MLAKCWLGKLKGELGSPTPYPAADKPENIPPTADVYEGELFCFPTNDPQTDLKMINQMREKIESAIGSVNALNYSLMRWWDETYPASPYFATIEQMFILWCLKALYEARFWYGFILADMRKAATI